MKVTPIKTIKVRPKTIDIFELLKSSLPKLNEGTVVAITSKVVSICEDRVIPIGDIDKKELVRRESDLYYGPSLEDDNYKFHFTIVNNTLIPASGIDESNGSGWYILWPEDPQLSADKICAYLKRQFGLKELGVIITDSTIFPSRYGTMGIAIGYSGFSPVKDYIGRKDIFGRELTVSVANVAGGLASTAVLVMGEGAEQTPFVLFEDVDFVDFKNTEKIDAGYYVSPLQDAPFAPFYNVPGWTPGGKSKLS